MKDLYPKLSALDAATGYHPFQARAASLVIPTMDTFPLNKFSDLSAGRQASYTASVLLHKTNSSQMKLKEKPYPTITLDGFTAKTQFS